LQDFIKLRGSAKKLADAVNQKYPKFYASVRPYTLQVSKQTPAILKYLERYRELYPEAHFPTVYFGIGRLTSGGTVSSRGLLIGAEVNSLGKGVDTSEINPSFVQAMGPVERIPLIVIHELIPRSGRMPGVTKLFHRFARDLAEKPHDASKWLYNYDTSGDEPADLGYWLGAEICRSYHAGAEGKAKAIRDVVTLESVEMIVRGSKSGASPVDRIW
jgi:hypothetical protein